MVKALFTITMEKAIRSSVMYANNGSEIWFDLEEIFGKESAPREYEIKQSLTITNEEGSFVSAYNTKLRSI